MLERYGDVVAPLARCTPGHALGRRREPALRDDPFGQLCATLEAIASAGGRRKARRWLSRVTIALRRKPQPLGCGQGREPSTCSVGLRDAARAAGRRVARGALVLRARVVPSAGARRQGAGAAAGRVEDPVRVVRARGVDEVGAEAVLEVQAGAVLLEELPSSALARAQSLLCLMKELPGLQKQFNAQLDKEHEGSTVKAPSL